MPAITTYGGSSFYNEVGTCYCRQIRIFNREWCIQVSDITGTLLSHGHQQWNFSFYVDVIPIKFIFLVLSIRQLDTLTFTDDAAVQFLSGVFNYNP